MVNLSTTGTSGTNGPVDIEKPKLDGDKADTEAFAEVDAESEAETASATISELVEDRMEGSTSTTPLDKLLDKMLLIDRKKSSSWTSRYIHAKTTLQASRIAPSQHGDASFVEI